MKTFILTVLVLIGLGGVISCLVWALTIPSATIEGYFFILILAVTSATISMLSAMFLNRMDK